MDNEIPNITDYDGSPILHRIGHASKLGYHYNDIKVPLDLNGSGGIFVMV